MLAVIATQRPKVAHHASITVASSIANFQSVGISLIKNIQALRAIAANGVVLSHLLIIETKCGAPVLPGAAHFGTFGVDLFFVISGFIMATITKEGMSPTAFLIGRARRILPPYWFYTTVVLAVSLVAPAIVNSSFGAAPSIWRSYLLIPDHVPPLLAVGWTLIHEMYFYLCFAGMLALAAAFKLAMPPLLLAWAAIIICLNAIFQVGVTNPIAAVVAHPLTLEFIFGAAVGILVKNKTLDYAGPALATGAGLLIAVPAFPDMATGFINDPGWIRTLVIGAPCALVVYGAAATERRSLPTASRWLVALGDASYSTYLSHVLVLSALGRLFSMMPSHKTEVAFVVACIVVANVVGVISARLIERRLTRRHEALAPARIAGTSRPKQRGS